MNDTEITKHIEDLKLESITFEHEQMGINRPYISCALKRPYFKSLPVIASSSTSEDAFARARVLLDKVRQLEKVMKIAIPDIENQTIDGGYHREMLVDDIEVEYKNIGQIFHISAITRKDSEGFYYLNTPIPLTKEYKFVEKKGDLDIYSWNTIGPLCGSRGLIVVKDGMIIKQKMTMRS